MNDELRITDELLKLLDDFRSNPYTAKQMEAKFEEWRRKAGAGSGSLSMADSNCLAQIAAATANGGTLKRNKDKVWLNKNSLIFHLCI